MEGVHSPSLIILEGPDLAGKSTLMDKFDSNKYVKRHFGAGEVITNAEDYFTSMVGHLDSLHHTAINTCKSVIIDRSWISDAAYVHVRNDGGRVTSMHNMSYNGLCLGLFRKVITVFLLPPWDIIEKRFFARGDSYVTLEQLKIAYNYYSGLQHNFTNIMYDCLRYGTPINHTAASVLFYNDIYNDIDDVYKVINDVESML